MKYFVILENNKLCIQETNRNMSSFPDFVPFSLEQNSFLEENPTATPIEIKNMQLTPSTAFDLILYKKEKLSIVSQLSLQTLNKFVPEYKMFNAQISDRNEGINTFYSLSEANNILSLYNKTGNICRVKFYEVKQQIDEAVNKESVDVIFINAINYYNAITIDEETA